MKDEYIHIGCSGYNASGWLDIFYPPGLPRSHFGFYVSHFGSYELNAFYKFPTVRSLCNWYAKAPEGFAFSVKAPKIITHIKKIEDWQTEIGTLYRTCSEAKAKAQMHPLPAAAELWLHQGKTLADFRPAGQNLPQCCRIQERELVDPRGL